MEVNRFKPNFTRIFTKKYNIIRRAITKTPTRTQYVEAARYTRPAIVAQVAAVPVNKYIHLAKM